MKFLYLLPIVFLTTTGAACNPSTPKDPCLDRPIYKAYQIDVPVRPKLDSANNDKFTSGLVVRTTESDMSLLMEYAQKLENIIKSLPSDLSTSK